ncbi:3,4-dihydroxy-2-butanone-4-phosphate synthase [Halieaceae bacterium IMCC14734]|uniref:3,4-dihydroxy-2-butanone 4-phosphate synthase n=1 Tax=Candidatus Litorirhabdus singularis TaxID=2518993 RepID=A0ABT3TM05_9GAMM|nr:3,4-dihydroxy-2-butanone-4-phosphate synthase [Candidatus Litorirhabdus singularis]MCX2982775.1 3,4-dihydroxy-2-butanone-4-phosphate synthase [Candidatus Litorirhabdus singularis]
MQLNSVEEIISDIRQGKMVVLLDDGEEKDHNEGVVMMAAEHVDASHVNFMARQARGLVCLTLTEERCQLLGLPPMADDPSGEKSNFTVSIEAREGITTGISAADRARTIQAAVAPTTVAEDIVQPGHIFPLTAVPGGVLTRAGHTEAASDYARLAGLQPAAMITDVLTADGVLANGSQLAEFAASHDLKIGSIADLIHFRVVSERTIRRVREGSVTTAHGDFRMVAYREHNTGDVHLALYQGDILAAEPTLVRVHLQSAVRDMVAASTPGRPSWNIGTCLQQVNAAGNGVVVLLARQESNDQLLQSIDIAFGNAPSEGVGGEAPNTYNMVGLGSQILRDLGVGKIRLMGAPIKYNAISGFDLEVTEYVSPAGLVD